MLPPLIVFLMVHLPAGAAHTEVWQHPEVFAVRRSSTKLNCTFTKTLQQLKPSLTWMKEQQRGGEVQVYPSELPLEQARVQVDAAFFQSRQDAGLILEDLRVGDSGVYHCCITVLQDGEETQYRGRGTRLIVTATEYDSLIACCPLGVLIAALLVLHFMIYQQYLQYRNLGTQRGRSSQEKRMRLPNIYFDFMDILSAF
ncbi:natural cytotoxicity triggering receptor 3-like [Ascaphus truei]|uniref:natural cytotoxicity triggering receptor 3-like n=1 Tax=Ascaphus truei TaxID=8439 RepID=UPI003F592505